MTEGTRITSVGLIAGFFFKSFIHPGTIIDHNIILAIGMINIYK